VAGKGSPSLPGQGTAAQNECSFIHFGWPGEAYTGGNREEASGGLEFGRNCGPLYNCPYMKNIKL